MCTSGDSAGREVCAPADSDNLVTKESGTSPVDLQPGLCHLSSMNLALQILESRFRRQLIWDSHHPPSQSSSPVPRTLQHLLSFCTKSGQELVCAHQTDVSWDSQLSLSASKPKGPLNSSCEWLTPGFSFGGAEQEWGKSLKVKLLPCKIIIYSSHKCL